MEPPASEEIISFDISEINTLVQVINACAQRGAFKPSEFVAVGQVHEKLLKIIKKTNPNVE